MRRFLWLAVGTFMAFTPGHPQPVHSPAPPAVAAPAAPIAFAGPAENQDDPAYRTYKEGYNLILDEKWKEAREKLGEVLAKHPKSEYVDDAEYWIAYALKHTDYRKSVEAYKKFIKSHPKSRYYDDALADLSNLDANITISAANDSGMVVIDGKGKGYAYAYGLDMQRMEHSMRKLNRAMRVRLPGQTFFPRGAITIPGYELGMERHGDDLDPETRLRMDALQAIGESTEDEKAFQTLKEVALDRKQAWPLREAAISMLGDFKKFDVFPVLLELARTDTNEEIQNAAIYRIGDVGKDKNRSVETLASLFGAIPKHRASQLQTVLYAIADVGNEKAVDFLTRVARTDENFDLRTDAVYLLGNIGGEKARSALYDILKGK